MTMLPEEMFSTSLPGGGLLFMQAETMGFHNPATSKPVALEQEYAQSGFNALRTATHAAGQDAGGLAAYEEIARSGQKGHEEVLSAAVSISGMNLNMQDRGHAEVQSLAAPVKSEGPARA